MKIIFDLETDGLLDDVTKVHCGVTYDVENDWHRSYGPDNPSLICAHLTEATELIGHNILGYDLPVLKKRYGWEPHSSVKITDTQILSRMIWPDIGATDRVVDKIPGKLRGEHSLRSWGYRLGELKGDYGEKDNAWEVFTPEMLSYCEQDVKVTRLLYELCLTKDVSEESIRLEHEFAKILSEVPQAGFKFDEKAAQKLLVLLQARHWELTQELKTIFPTVVVPMERDVEAWDSWQTKQAAKKKNHIGWNPRSRKTMETAHEFNPNSRQSIAWHLNEKYGWVPSKLTDSKLACMDEDALKKIDFPEAKVFAEILMLNKRIGQVANGDKAWLKLVSDDGRLRGGMVSIGTPHFRIKHFEPNISQVPNEDAPYGPEARECFTAGPGRRLIGIDAKGIQLRCLAHRLFPYDNGAYAKKVLMSRDKDGKDIHDHHQEDILKVEKRSTGKTITYGWLFGEGDEERGKKVGGGAAEGQELRRRLFEGIDGLPQLMWDLNNQVAFPNRFLLQPNGRRKWKKLKEPVTFKRFVESFSATDWRIFWTPRENPRLQTLHGAWVPVRSPHVVLNYRLASDEAILMKRACIDAHNELVSLGLKRGPQDDYQMIGYFHDEYQFDVHPDAVEVLKRVPVEAIQHSGDSFDFKCRMDAEAKVGDTWAETH